MPCCIGMIRFLRCGHYRLFKLGCTLDCDALCEPGKQLIMVATKYRGYCEECHGQHWGKHDDERALEWAKLLRRAEKNVTLSKDERTNITADLMMREDIENHRRDRVSMSIIEEIQWAEDWTAAYGNQLWKYRFAGEPEKATSRLQYLKSVRKWDLVVVKDILRTPAMLIADQHL